MSTIVRKPANTKSPITVRWTVDGKNHEKSFSTRKEAAAYKTDLDHSLRYGTEIDTSAGKALFGTAADTWLTVQAGKLNPRTVETYSCTYGKHVKPVLGNMTLAAVAKDRDLVTDLLCVQMAALSVSVRRQARMLIVAVCDEAVLAGKLHGHKLAGIDLGRARRTAKYRDFAPATEDQIDVLAAAAGIWVHVMHGTGARPEEAIGADKADFITAKGQRMFRISGQATRSGRDKVLCKKRYDADDVRMVPCPKWLWDKIQGCGDGPLMPGNGRMYVSYEQVRPKFNTARDAVGLPSSFTAHSIRHQWGSVLLRAGVPLTDVSGFLGHRDARTTASEYRSELDGAAVDTLTVLDGLRAA